MVGVLITFIVLFVAVDAWIQQEPYYGDSTTADTTTVFSEDTMSVAAPLPTDTGVSTTDYGYPTDTTAVGTDTTGGYYYGDTTAM